MSNVGFLVLLMGKITSIQAQTKNKKPPSCRGLIVPPWDVMQRGRVETKSVTHNYYSSSMKSKFYKNTRLAGKIIEKTSLANFYSKTHITINNLSIKSIYRNKISPTLFREKNNKPTST